jgi:hypothetical protein
MSEQERESVDKIVEHYCQRIDDRHRRQSNLIYGLIIAFVGSWAIWFVSFGEVRSEVRRQGAILSIVSKEYIPTFFLEGLQKNYMFYTKEMIARITNNKEELDEIGNKYSQFQQDMTKQMIQMRGGVTTDTRSLKSETPRQ